MSNTVTLKNSELTVTLSTFGGTITSVRDTENVEYLWQGDPKYWSGQAPILFPICGSIRDDKAVIGDGGRCTMPRHGLIRKREFELVKAAEDTASFLILSDEALRESYPYDFKFYAEYRLVQRSIRVTYRVENTSGEKMPFFVGGHPGFNCPIAPGEKYSDYYLKFEKTENCTVPAPVTETGLIDMEHRTTGLADTDRLQLAHSLFHKDAIIMDELQSRSVELRSDRSDRGIRLDYQDFPYLIVWSSANDGDFVALEPWTGLSTCSDESDVFEEKRNVQIAAPGEKREYSYTITVL